MLLHGTLFCQETKYYSSSGGLATKNDCHYYSIEKEVDGKLTDSVKSYYCSNTKLKSIKYYNQGKLVGSIIEYFPNGNIERTSTYRDGRPIDKTINYYQSGIKRSVYHYNNPESDFNWKYLIESTWDSLGMPGVQNYNGFCKGLLTVFGEEVGNVKDGLKDSVWITFDPKTKVKLHEDVYVRAEFVRGKRFVNNNVIEYNSLESTASPKLGMPAFYKELSRKLKYPKEARKAKIEGKVFVQFVINKDGTIQDVKCIKGIGGGCDEAAVELI